MANFNTIGTRCGPEYVTASIVMRFGRREMYIGPDFRKRYAVLNPLLDCRTGSEIGYVELLLLRRWLIVLSIAR